MLGYFHPCVGSKILTNQRSWFELNQKIFIFDRPRIIYNPTVEFVLFWYNARLKWPNVFKSVWIQEADLSEAEEESDPSHESQHFPSMLLDLCCTGGAAAVMKAGLHGVEARHTQDHWVIIRQTVHVCGVLY